MENTSELKMETRRIKEITLVFSIFMLFLGAIFTASAQDDRPSATPDPNITFTHLFLEDGLSDNRIMVMEQDHQGFIWIGTQRGGLNRYDGYDFTVYKSDRDNETSISNNFIWSMFEDSQNNLWVGTNGGGLNLYDHATDSFIHYPIDESGVPHANIKTIAEDADGTLWLGGSSAGGFTKFNRETGEFSIYQLEVDDDGIRDIHQDRETGLLWLGTYDHGILLFDSETEEFVKNYPSNLDDPTTLSSNYIQQTTQNRNGDIWITTNNGLNRFNRETETFTRYLNDPDDPTSPHFDAHMLEDSKGRFWVTGNKGLNLYHPGSDTFTTYVHDPDDPTSLSGNFIYSLFEDDSGGLWIGVNGQGVSRVGGEPVKFDVYRSSQNNPNSLSGNGVRYLYAADEDNIWIGANGVNHFDGENFTRYIHDPDDPTSLSHNLISAIVEDPRGGLWITTDNGVNHFDGENFTRYMHDPDDPDSLGGPIAVGAHLDDRGGLWISIYSVGMDYFDGEKFIHFRPGDDSGITSRWPYDIVEDAYVDRVWVATFGSIMEIDLETQIFTEIFPTREMLDLEIVPSNQFINLYQDESGLLWVGGGESGLMLFDPDTQEVIKHYTTKDGLTDNSVTGVVGDEQGYLWISTNNGLSQFNPDTETFRNFYASDGLQSNQLTTLAIAPDGQIFVGGTGGLSAFYPEQIQDNLTIPPVVLTGFELFNEPVAIGAEDSPLTRSINTTDELVLNYDQSVFTFEFSALNYSVPERNQYAYRMEGFDDDWQYTTSGRRFATYTNLNPGHYIFRVKASNNDGIWNEEGASLAITITPPWWQTWWAYGLYAIMGIGLIRGVIMWRTRQTRKRNQQLKRQIEQQKQHQEERERLLKATEEQSRRVQSIMDTVPQGILLLDSTYHTLIKNPIAEQQLPVLATTDETGSIVGLGDRTLTDILTSPPVGLWHEVIVRDIEPNRYFAVIARPIEMGNVHHQWVVVFRDITEERLIQDRANTQNRLASIGQFAAGIAHDFNNMLSVILLNADLLRRYAKLDNRFEEKAERITLQGRSASKLIQQILDYSRQAIMQRHAVDLNSLLINEINLISQILPENIAVNYEVLDEDTRCLAYIDPTRIQQVMMNLVINARDAMPDGGQLDIQLSRVEVTDTYQPFDMLTSGSWVSIAVKDTGTGIPPELLPRIFEPFVTTKAIGKGTGLGLAQIFGIVKQHDGHIDVQTAQHKGTTFTVYLPEYVTGDVASLIDVDTGKDVIAGHGETILIVEDMTSLREALAESLRNLGYEIITRKNGRDALDNWDNNTTIIDLVLSDVVMPEMSGIAFLKAIRQQDAKQPCIFMTGHLMGQHDDLDLAKLRESGIVELVPKPIEFATLQGLIADVLKQSEYPVD